MNYILSELNSRFMKHKEILSSFKCLIQSGTSPTFKFKDNFYKFPYEIIKYARDNQELQQNISLNICALLNYLPLSTCSTERSFSNLFKKLNWGSTINMTGALKCAFENLNKTRRSH